MISFSCFLAKVPIDVGTHKWLKLNYDQVGYYRINYSPEMWLALTEALTANVSVCVAIDVRSD